MTVNDILEKLYEANKILETLGSTNEFYIVFERPDGNITIDVEKLEHILEDYKSMLGNMKVKE